MTANNNWSKWKRKAPKVPDHTCPTIDDILDDLNNLREEHLTIRRREIIKITRKLERLRSANDALRSSGIYWYDLCKNYLKPIKIELIDDIKKYSRQLKTLFFPS
jgi:hypothetical protein|tara:strand:+ start:453 stop:767 length:315 start_codon:yes stop_codon:yes gene_type:complete